MSVHCSSPGFILKGLGLSRERFGIQGLGRGGLSFRKKWDDDSCDQRG